MSKDVRSHSEAYDMLRSRMSDFEWQDMERAYYTSRPRLKTSKVDFAAGFIAGLIVGKNRDPK